MKRKSLLLALLLTSLAMNAFAFAVSPLFHASARGSNNVTHLRTANSMYTIRYFGADGSLVRSWHGSKADADKIKGQERIRREKLLPAPQDGQFTAINRVNNCT